MTGDEFVQFLAKDKLSQKHKMARLAGGLLTPGHRHGISGPAGTFDFGEEALEHILASDGEANLEELFDPFSMSAIVGAGSSYLLGRAVTKKKNRESVAAAKRKASMRNAGRDLAVGLTAGLGGAALGIHALRKRQKEAKERARYFHHVGSQGSSVSSHGGMNPGRHSLQIDSRPTPSRGWNAQQHRQDHDRMTGHFRGMNVHGNSNQLHVPQRVQVLSSPSHSYSKKGMNQQMARTVLGHMPQSYGG